MSLTTPEKIRTLQRKLFLKAKAEPEFRFYPIYDKVWRADILAHAYALARTNQWSTKRYLTMDLLTDHRQENITA